MLYFFSNRIRTAVSHPVLHAIFAMRFSTKVFEHDKITRWRHCNADSSNTPKASDKCVYRMTKYVAKILL